MAQHDYIISNQTFPNTRQDINNLASAIATNNSGTSAPTTQYAGQFWIDTTTTNWTLYIHDGTDDIQFATIDTSANTVNFVDSALDVVTDTTPQLGGDLDLNSNDITGTGNINITGTATLSGTVTGQDFRHAGDSDTYFGFPTDNQLQLVGGNAEILRVYQIAGAYGILQVNGSGSATYPNFTFNGDSNTGMYRATTDTLAFTTGGSEALRIDSSGNVGIGTTTPDLGFGGTYLEVANLSQTPSITIRSDRAGGGTLQFADQDDNNPGYISYQHNNDRMVFRAGDNQQVYIDGAGCMMLGTFTPGSAGNGDLVVNGNIYLGGTGSANALDDYEEGTFTPTLSAGACTFSYANQAGYYTKVGRMVHYVIYLRGTGTGTTANTVQITGLPFTSLNASLYEAPAATWNSVSAGDARPILNTNNTNFSIYYAGTTSQAVVNDTQDKYLLLQGSYETN